MTKKLSTSVVLIADRVTNHNTASISSLDLEMTEESQFEAVTRSLRELVTTVYHYDNPENFINNIHKHRSHLVLSLWSGELSRNRRALVPSICEAYGISYIGADTYSIIVCQDKALSKTLMRQVGLNTPNWVLVSSSQDLTSLELLSPPLVVKPNLQGGSIGISAKSLVPSITDAREEVRLLLQMFGQPVLVEEFAPGREVSISILGRGGRIEFMEASELFFTDDPSFLENRLFSLELKKASDRRREHRLITEAIEAQTSAAAVELFTTLDKVETLRVDGRLSKEGFSCLELTPDIHLGETATWSSTFRLKGISHVQMFEMVIHNCLGRD